MVNPGIIDQTHALLADRNTQYADAWKYTGLVIVPVMKSYISFCEHAPQYALPWITILCKLLRALGTPFNPDHWADIAGYATLVKDDIDAHTPGQRHVRETI